MLTMMQWLLMAAILRNDNNAYGPVIYETANELAHPNRIPYGSLYPTLDRWSSRDFYLPPSASRSKSAAAGLAGTLL